MAGVGVEETGAAGLRCPRAMPSRADIRRRDRLAALLLLVLIVALGVALILRRSVFEDGDRLAQRARLQHEAIELDRFSARRERSAGGDRLSVSLRLRTSVSVSLPCYVFVVARNDQASPKLWAIWPPQPPGPAITAGGHFHGATPNAGYAMTLSDRWERLTATVPHPSSGSGFDTVVIYVVAGDGRILLERPFRV
jgi:hypothetical protein